MPIVDPFQAASTEEQRRDRSQLRLWHALAQASRDLIYITLQRAGGEPFGAPYERGLPSLTTRLVRFFKQKSFFAFNSVERLGTRSSRNKFTRHGAALYRGLYRSAPPQVLPRHGVVPRLAQYIRDNRYFQR